MVTGIDNHKPVICSLAKSVEELQQELKSAWSSPYHHNEQRKVTRLRAKLDDINQRYDEISHAVTDHGEYLDSLLNKLRDFEEKVENLEEWVLPVLEQLETAVGMGRSLAEFGDKLQVRVVRLTRIAISQLVANINQLDINRY